MDCCKSYKSLIDNKRIILELFFELFRLSSNNIIKGNF
jgi:hypothetical protein